MARATPEAEDVREPMEIRHASFLLKNARVLQSALKPGNGVEHWAHLFLTRMFDTRLAHAQFASNIQVNYHLLGKERHRVAESLKLPDRVVSEMRGEKLIREQRKLRYCSLLLGDCLYRFL